MREASNGAEPIAVVVDATARYLATEDPACLFDPSVDEAVFQLTDFGTSDINFAGQAWYSLGRLFWHRSEVGPETDQEYERQMAVSYLVNALDTRIQHFNSVQEPSLLTDAVAEDALSKLDGVDLESLDVAKVLGWFHWLRYLQDPEDDSEREHVDRCFGHLAAAIPSMIRHDLLSASRPELRVAELVDRGQRTGDVAYFQEAADLCDDTLAKCVDDEDYRSIMLSNYAIALMMWADLVDDENARGMLDRAAEMAAESVRTTHASDLCRRNRGLVLLRRYDRFGVDADLDDTLSMVDLAAIHNGALDTLVTALEKRYQRRHDVVDLNRAVVASRQMCDNMPENPTFRVRLAVLLRQLAEHERAPAGFIEPVGIVRAVLRDLPGQSSDYAELLVSMTGVLLANYAVNQVLADLEEGLDALTRMREATAAACRTNQDYDVLERAIAVFRQADDLVPEGHSRVDLPSVAMIDALLARYLRRGDAADLAAIVNVAERFPATPGNVQSRVVIFSHCTQKLATRQGFETNAAEIDAVARIATLGATATADVAVAAIMWWNSTIALHARYRLSGSREDLDALIDAAQLAAANFPEEAPASQRAVVHQSLSGWLTIRFREYHLETDLDAAFEAQLRTSWHGAEPDSSQMEHWLDLADFLVDRAGAADADRAIECYRRGLAVAPAEDRRQVALLLGLARAWYIRHESSGDVSGLDKAIEVAQQAITTGSAGWEGTGWTEAQARLVLASFLGLKIQRVGGLETYESASDNARLGVAAAEGGEFEVTTLSILIQVLLDQFVLERDPATLAEAMDRARHIVSIAANDKDLAVAAASLGSVLRHQGEALGDTAALAECVRVTRDGLRFEGLPQLLKKTLSTELAAALRAQHLHFGSIDLLNESIEIRRLLVASETSNWDIAKTQSNLSRALRDRYERVGRLSDLTEALAALRLSVEAFPYEGPFTARNRSDLVSGLFAYYARSGDSTALDEAIDVGRRLIAAVASSHFDRALMMSNLARSLIMRYEHAGNPADLREAIEFGQRAVAVPTSSQVESAQRLHDLGQVYRTAFSRSDDETHRSEAITCFRAALAAIPDDHQFRAAIQHNLAQQLVDFADEGALSEAASHLRASARHAGAPVPVRYESVQALAFVETARGKPANALAALRDAVALLPRLVTRAQQWLDQEHHLRRMPWLPQAAAVAALRMGDADEALTLLDRSRGVLLTQVLETRDDFADLRERHPRLASRLDVVRAEFGDDPTGHAAGDRHHHADGEWNRLVSEVRQQPDFERFLLPPAIEELRAAAAHGPIVVLTAAVQHGIALIVTPDSVEQVKLDGAGVDALAAHVDSFLAALNSSEWGANDSILETLSWLWDTVADPVLTKLRLRSNEGAATRLWWCPTGLATALPIHAAGHHVRRLAPGGRVVGVHDRVISSYTPTIRALINARRNLKLTTVHRPLVVAMPRTRDLPDLANAVDEAFDVAHRFDAVEPLIGESATRERVLAELVDAEWVHMACHATYNDQAPSNSALHLYDGPLSVLDIIRARGARSAQFAYLSACSTARAGGALPDEAVHISTAFQLAGYPHVVGTLWPISDEVAATVAQGIYDRLERKPRDLAKAVHAATSDVRSKYIANPRLWAAHVHIGP